MLSIDPVLGCAYLSIKPKPWAPGESTTQLAWSLSRGCSIILDLDESGYLLGFELLGISILPKSRDANESLGVASRLEGEWLVLDVPPGGQKQLPQPARSLEEVHPDAPWFRATLLNGSLHTVRVLAARVPFALSRNVDN